MSGEMLRDVIQESVNHAKAFEDDPLLPPIPEKLILPKSRCNYSAPPKCYAEKETMETMIRMQGTILEALDTKKNVTEIHMPKDDALTYVGLLCMFTGAVLLGSLIEMMVGR